MRLQQAGRFVAANDCDRDRTVARGGHLFGGASAKRRQQETETRLAATS
jgi:hypothetical protein